MLTESFNSFNSFHNEQIMNKKKLQNNFKKVTAILVQFLRKILFLRSFQQLSTVFPQFQDLLFVAIYLRKISTDYNPLLKTKANLSTVNQG